MWELFWQSSHVAVDRAGPLAWQASLDGPRLVGSALPTPRTSAHAARHDRHRATGAASGCWGDGPSVRALAGAGVSVSGGPARYEIRVAGVLDSRWSAWFNGLQISGQGKETVICGLLADQPALHGLLTKVRDLGLCLISVRRLDTGQAETRHHDQT